MFITITLVALVSVLACGVIECGKFDVCVCVCDGFIITDFGIPQPPAMMLAKIVLQ
jgi:hypothetical protein